MGDGRAHDHSTAVHATRTGGRSEGRFDGQSPVATTEADSRCRCRNRRHRVDLGCPLVTPCSHQNQKNRIGSARCSEKNRHSGAGRFVKRTDPSKADRLFSVLLEKSPG